MQSKQEAGSGTHLRSGTPADQGPGQLPVKNKPDSASQEDQEEEEELNG